MDNIPPKDEYRARAYGRNGGLIPPQERDILWNATVAVAGVGGVGGTYVISLARLGLGNLKIADLDDFGLENVNRQEGARVSAFGKSKVDVIEAEVHDINPHLHVEKFSDGINADNIDQFLKDADLVLDGIDFFNIEDRRMLFKRARELGKIVLTCAPVGFGGSLLVFHPKGISFDEYFDIHGGGTLEEDLLKFGVGFTPSLIQRAYYTPDALNIEKKEASSTRTGILTAASLISSEVVKLLLKRGKVLYAPTSTHFDPFVRKLKVTHLRGGNRHPFQRLKLWYAKRLLTSRA
jgi:molybdopterin/thiamine biosynthesis adenylyltransferase